MSETTLVYRITSPQYVGQALSGMGAAQVGGRWNSKGTRIAYTASSASLAILEMLVHVDRQSVPTGHRLLTYSIPSKLIATLRELPEGWDQLPHQSGPRQAGDDWAKAVSDLALRVPSAVVAGEHNILINPLHGAVDAIGLVDNTPLALDARLFA